MSITWTKELLKAINNEEGAVFGILTERHPEVAAAMKEAEKLGAQIEIFNSYDNMVPSWSHIHPPQFVAHSAYRVKPGWNPHNSCGRCQYLDRPREVWPCRDCTNFNNFEEYLPLLPPDAKKD